MRKKYKIIISVTLVLLLILFISRGIYEYIENYNLVRDTEIVLCDNIADSNDYTLEEIDDCYASVESSNF